MATKNQRQPQLRCFMSNDTQKLIEILCSNISFENFLLSMIKDTMERSMATKYPSIQFVFYFIVIRPCLY